MHELESRAEELAKKSALLPNEKEQLAAIEKEMSDLEMKYLADRKKRMPDVELDAQGGAMMHLINSIPNVQVNMEQSTTPALAAVAAGVISPEAAALLPVVTEIESPESSERAAISDAVLNKYKEAFGIEEETLEQIPGFRALTPGKQLLILRNMQNEVLQQVSGEADKTQKEEWKGKTVWGKLWNGVRTMGTYQTIRTKKIKKELLAAAQGEGKNQALRTEALLGHVENIEEYVKVMNTAPNVTLNPENGSLTIAYAISREGNESPKNLDILDEFNLIASKFAAVPREWGYEPKDEKEKGQYETYQTERNNYFKGREALIALYTSTFSEHGEADPRKEAMFAMSRIDERIELDQLFNAHPDAEKALNEIEDQNAIMSGVKEFWQDKGKYVAFGAAARMTATAITGALTGGIAAPFAYVIAGGVGAGVGRAQGRNEAKKIIRQRRIDRRLSEEDEREEITLKLEPLEARMKPLQTELLKNDLGVQRRMDIKKQLAQLQQRIDSGEQLQKTRKIKEFTDATFFTDRIERLTLKLEQVETPEERTLLESKIAKTTALMERKFKSGLINFGGSSVGENDERKGNDIANKLSFIQAMGKGAAVEIIDPLLLRIEMGRIIGDHQGKIESLRDKEVKNAGIKAAVIRGGFALGGAYLAGKIHESGIVDDFFKKIASYKTEAAAIGIKEAFHQYAPGDVAHLRAAVLAHKDPDYPAELVEGANRAQANGLAEYMASNDPDVRHRIAETMGLTEAEIDARIHHFLEIAEHSHLPEEAAAAPHAAASAASAPSAPASAVSAPEAAGSVVEAEVVSLSEANGLAHDYLTADMISHNTASSELLSQEWRFMSDKNAESILSATKEQAVQSPGGADMWPSILHMQAYAKANGFTQAEGITPKSGETLEQFFLRAHAEHIMKHGVVPRVSDATVPQELGNRLVGPVPQNLSEYVTPNKPPIKVDPPLKPFSEQQVNVPSWQDNKPQLIGGSGAVPHQHSPDGGVPQRGAIGWPESKPQLDTAPHAVAPLPPPPPRPEFIREASPAFPRGLPPPPPPADFMRAPTGALPNNAPALPSPPPRPEFMTAAPNQDAGFIKASFAEDVVPTGVRMTPPTLNVLRAPYPGMEQNIDRALAPMLVQARTAFGPAVDRPAVEVMSELKVSGNSLYRPFGQFLERGYVPHEGESAIAFYERCAREEFLKVKMPSTHETVVTTEAIPKVTPEARFTHNVDRLWEKLLWKNSQHEYLTNRNNTAEDLLDGKIPVSPKDVNGNSLKYWQESIRALRVKSGVVPEHGEQVEAYGKRAVAEMLRKNPLLKRDDILADRGMTESAPRVQAAPFSEVSREVTHEGIAIPKVDPEAAKHTAMIADKWAQTAKEGLNKNSFWETARNQSALMFDKVPKAQGGAQGSVQEAYAQMQGLVKKAGEMGFAANQDETAGAFLDRVAGELHVPLTAKALSVRSEHITDALGKYMPVKTDSTRLVAAETIFANKELAGQPHSPEIDDVIMVQRVLLRVQQHTGISPKPGEDVHHYLLRAVSEQLIKTPELHASTLLAPKGAAFQPADAASSVGGKPPSLVRVPPLPVKPNLRWDQQA